MVIYLSISIKIILYLILEDESERASSTPPSRLTPPPNEQAISPSSGNETQTEHESDNE
jgi:hypothetical protein